MNYYIADTHFGHANIIKFCNRPYKTVEEMDEELIFNWNNKVHHDDDVYIVGDFIYKQSVSPEVYINKLKGRKHLIMGNHDHSWLKNIDGAKWFEDISPLKLIYDCDAKSHIVLCHYPLMTWIKEKQGAYMVYGHIHNHTEDLPFWTLIRDNAKMLNAGVDVNFFSPATIKELVVYNDLFKRGVIA